MPGHGKDKSIAHFTHCKGDALIASFVFIFSFIPFHISFDNERIQQCFWKK